MKQQIYFHVVAWTRQSTEDPIFLFGDLSETQLKRQFVRPYRIGGKLHLGQRVLNAAELTRVMIIETLEPKAEVLKALQERSLRQIEEVNLHTSWEYWVSTGYGWDDDDITYAGNDVTARYVRGRPGSPSLLYQIAHSHWLRVVGAGLVLLAISA
ncbi:hypothetical protein PWG15_25240 (plasmid) [Ensifer adhaerens]|uniref:hypothetical protein n=1 Tax=Ensifer adhaerens TaxID=106592 RepID=UPI0023A96E67|nr:hypothetical protein [Ensifer adhaerens]WDZ81055.1 hypothetical protein PWG15_25240 [Ensifer adhaerens]